MYSLGSGDIVVGGGGERGICRAILTTTVINRASRLYFPECWPLLAGIARKSVGRGAVSIGSVAVVTRSYIQ